MDEHKEHLRGSVGLAVRARRLSYFCDEAIRLLGGNARFSRVVGNLTDMKEALEIPMKNADKLSDGGRAFWHTVIDQYEAGWRAALDNARDRLERIDIEVDPPDGG